MRSLTGLFVLGVLTGFSDGLKAGELPAAARDNVVQALDEGFEVGASHAAASSALLDKARGAARGDPRVLYAAGLIHFKQLKLKEAASEFERAAKVSGEPYWPAWQAWTWCAFRDRKQQEGLDRLEQLVKQLAGHSNEETVRDTVHWTGQVLGAVQRTETDAASQSELIEFETRVRELLSDSLEETLDEGLVSLNEIEDRLREESDAEVNLAKNRHTRAANAERAKLDANLNKASQKAQQANRSAEEWKTWLDGEVARFDKQLKSLEKDYNFLVQRKASLEQSISLVGREITALEANRNPMSDPLAQSSLNQAIGQRRAQMLNYENDHSATSLRILQAATAGKAVVVQKLASIQQYEKATGSIADAKAKADKWSDRLQARKSRIKPLRGMTPARPAITFVSLVPFDLDASRERLLKDLAGNPGVR